MKVFFIIFFSAFAALTLYADDNWFWQNPIPQGNKYYCIIKTDTNTLYACGECGIIVKSTNAGSSWQIKNSSSTFPLNSIYFINANTGWAVGGKNTYSEILKTTNAGENWFSQSRDTTYTLQAVYFINPLTGWAAGGYYSKSMLLKTTNGGLNWVQKSTGTTDWYYGLIFVNNNTGWIGSFGKILKSTDAGESWIVQSTNSGGRVLFFLNADTGWTASSSGGVRKTTNGGLNWVQITYTGGGFNSLYFISADTGFAGINGLATTTNGGINWTNFTNGSSESMNSMCMIDKNTFYIAGWYGYIYKTTNQGTNWLNIKQGFTLPTTAAIVFVDLQTGFVSGYDPYTTGFVYKTTNGGNNWAQVLYHPAKFGKVFFSSFSTGWVVGPNGTSSSLFKTTNCGNNWESVINWTYCEMKIPYFINDQTGFIGGNILYSYSGRIMKTTNSGASWTTVGGGSSLYSLYMINSVYGIAGLSGSLLLHTTNGGNNWYYGYTGGFGDVSDFCFINENTGWATANYSILKSTDKGFTWQQQLNVTGSGYFGAVFFINTETGWAGSSGNIYYTTNSGNNWILYPSFTDMSVGDIYFNSYSTGWIAGSYGSILKTTNGGNIVGVKTITGKEPNKFYLYQNYPNPFNPSTKIKFNVGLDSRFRGNGKVVLKVYDVLGKEIATLVNEKLKPGSYEIEFPARLGGDGTNLPSGIYFYQLITNSYIESRKMILIK